MEPVVEKAQHDPLALVLDGGDSVLRGPVDRGRGGILNIFVKERLVHVLGTAKVLGRVLVSSVDLAEILPRHVRELVVSNGEREDFALVSAMNLSFFTHWSNFASTSESLYSLPKSLTTTRSECGDLWGVDVELTNEAKLARRSGGRDGRDGREGDGERLDHRFETFLL